MSERAICFHDVSKRYWLRHGFLKQSEFWALKDINFEIQKGKTVGILGSNGAGKTTILKLLAGVTSPTKGSVNTRGRLVPLIELNAGFHSELSGRENIYLNGSILGIPKRVIDRNYDQIVEFSELSDFIDQPVKNYSFGMFMRLGFSVAVHSEPDLLLIDEVLTVGDEKFRLKCLEQIKEFQRKGVTILVVSHEHELIQEICEQVIYLEKGHLLAFTTPEEVISKYLNKNNQNQN